MLNIRVKRVVINKIVTTQITPVDIEVGFRMYTASQLHAFDVDYCACLLHTLHL
jgi:hypothetical protein